MNIPRAFLNLVKQHKKLSIAAFIIITILVVFLTRSGQGKSLLTEKVKRGDVSLSITANGTIFAKTSVNLSFPLSGTLTYLSVGKNDTVSAYQTIALLDQRSVQKNLEVVLRNYSIQRNTFDQTRENNQGRKPADALTDAVKRILENNQYDLEKAVLSVELQDLVKQQSVLTSPIAGIVTRADVNSIGVYVSTSTVFTIVDPATLIFSMEVDEADIAKVRESQRVKVTLDAFPDTVFEGTITSIDFASHVTSSGSTAYTVEVGLTKKEEMVFRLGLTGTGEIIIEEKKDVLYIPSFAVIDNKFVFVKTDSGVQKREVVFGLQNDTQSEIISGLAENETVIAEHEGQKINN